MDGTLGLCRFFDGYLLPMIVIVKPDDCRSSLLNGHEVMKRSTRKFPSKLLVFREYGTVTSFLPRYSLGNGDSMGVLVFFRLSWIEGGDDVIKISWSTFTVALSSAALPFLTPCLVTPGLGNGLSVTIHCGGLVIKGKQSESILYFVLSSFSQHWMTKQPEMTCVMDRSFLSNYECGRCWHSGCQSVGTELLVFH